MLLKGPHTASRAVPRPIARSYRGLTEYIVITRAPQRCITPSNRVATSARVVPGSARARIVAIKQTPHEGRFVCSTHRQGLVMLWSQTLALN